MRRPNVPKLTRLPGGSCDQARIVSRRAWREYVALTSLWGPSLVVVADRSVEVLFDGVVPAKRQRDARTMLDLMTLERLGRHSAGVGCLYLKDLEKVDLAVLEEIVEHAYQTLTAGTFTNRARDASEASEEER